MTISIQEYKDAYEFLVESYLAGRISLEKFHQTKAVYCSQLPKSDTIKALNARLSQVDQDMIDRARIHMAMGVAQSNAISAYVTTLAQQEVVTA